MSITHVLQGFTNEMEKLAGLLPDSAYTKGSDYDKRRLLDIKAVIDLALDPKQKFGQNVREELLKGAFESLKSAAYSIASTANPKSDNEAKCCPEVAKEVKNKNLPAKL